MDRPNPRPPRGRPDQSGGGENPLPPSLPARAPDAPFVHLRPGADPGGFGEDLLGGGISLRSRPGSAQRFGLHAGRILSPLQSFSDFRRPCGGRRPLALCHSNEDRKDLPGRRRGPRHGRAPGDQRELGLCRRLRDRLLSGRVWEEPWWPPR